MLRTVAYCDGTTSQRVLETVLVREVPGVATDEFASSDMDDNEMSMEKDADNPFAASRAIEESTGNGFLDRLQPGGFKLHRLLLPSGDYSTVCPRSSVPTLSVIHGAMAEPPAKAS